MSLYGKLSEYRNQFICIHTLSCGSALRSSGLLIELNHDYLTLRLYDKDTGEPSSEFSVPVNTVTALWAGHRDERELCLKASLAASGKAEDE